MIDDEIMINEPEKKLKGYKKSAQIWTILFTAVALIAGIVITGLVLDQVLKGTRGGEIEISDNKVDALKSYIGTELQELNEIIRKEFGISTTQGVFVNTVIEGSPSDDAGIEQGDVILRFNRQRVQNTSQLQNLIAGTSSGDTVKVVVERRRQTRSLYVKVSEIQTTASLASLTADTTVPSDDSPISPGWGMGVSPLTPDMAEEYGMAQGESGVLVTSVIAGAAADDSGIEVGDIILSANQQATEDLPQLYDAIDDTQGSVLDIFRDGQTSYTTVVADSSMPPVASLGMTTPLPMETGKVAIATVCENLDAILAVRFSFAQYFLIVTLPSDDYIAVINPRSVDTQLYGVRAAQIVIDQDVTALITSGIGPQAFDMFTNAGVKVYLARQGETAIQALEEFKKGILPLISAPNLPGSASYSLTAGGPSEDDSEDEVSGYKGIPPVIPPTGKYDPTLIAAQTIAGSTNRVEVCICPMCGTTVTHPPSIPCSEMNCPVCGSRLINFDSGMTTAYGTTTAFTQGVPQQQVPQQPEPQQQDPQRPSYAGAAKGQRDLDTVALSAEDEEESKGQMPSLIPPMGNPSDNSGLNVINIYQIAGQPVSNQPTDMPPMGNPTASLVAGQTTASQPAEIPPMGKPTATLTAGGPPVDDSSNRVVLCICPVCGITVGHPAGLPCSELLCPQCGNRLISLDSETNTNASQPQGSTQGSIPPGVGQGLSQGSTSDTGQSTVQGSTGSIGSGGSGAGGPTGYCVCTICGILVPHVAGTPCYEILCPQCDTYMVRAIPGVTISNKPETTPPTDMGQGSMTTSGKPETTPPTDMGQGSMTTSGKPETIPPTDMGQGSMTTSGKPETTPPTDMGQGSMTTSGKPETIPPTDMGQGSMTTASTGSAKVAIASLGKKLTSQVAPLFDNAPYFIIAGLANYEVIKNPNSNDTGDVGIQTTQFVVNNGAGAVIVNNISLQAMNELSRLNVRVYSGVSGSIEQVLDWYMSNRLQETTDGGSDENEASEGKTKEKFGRDAQQTSTLL